MTASEGIEEGLICVGVKLQSGQCAADSGVEGAVKDAESHHFVVQFSEGTNESNELGDP
jgi:hypothetical protein